jgi:ferredoxin
MKGLRYLPDVTTLTFDESACTGCGMCVQVCPHAVLSLKDRSAEVVDRDACMECGACVRNCPEGALSVRPGVGCASAIIASFFRRDDDVCC